MISNLLAIIIPTFGVIGVGWFARRINVWQQPAVAGLNNYAFYIALPALIFQSLVNSDFSNHITIDDLKLFMGVLATHLVIIIIGAIAIGTQKKISVGTKAAFPMLITFGSTAYVGIPFATRAFGQSGTVYASLLSVMLVTTLLFCSIFIFNRYNRGEKIRHNNLRSMLELPFIWAVAAGLLWPLLNLPPLPNFMAEFVGGLAAGASATALLGLGAFLYDLNPREIPWLSVGIASYVKVTAATMLTFIVLKLLGVSGLRLAIGVAMAATPTAITCFIISEKYRLGERLTAGTIFVSVFFSMAMLSTISYLWLATNVFQ